MLYIVNVEIFLRANFRGQAAPTKIKLTNICTHEELAAALRWAAHTHENLSPRKFNPQNIVTTKVARLR